MGLSSEIISEFVKATKVDNNTKKETTVYGTTVKYNGTTYVRIDGSDRLTPISTTTDTKSDERVTVMIKDHKATVTGNLSSPSARIGTVNEVADQISEFEIVMAHKVSTDELEAINATIDNLRAKTASFTNMEAVNATIETLRSKYANLTHVSATDIEALNADIENLRVMFGEFTDISTEDLNAINADIDNLKAYNGDFAYVSAEVLEAVKAQIKEADIKYVKIDFANINEAWLEELYAKSGLIENVVISEGHITGNLVGVTIKGDIIEGNTVVADKLVIRGEDGLFYKLNVEGRTIDVNKYFEVIRNSNGDYEKTDVEIEEQPEREPMDGLYTTDGHQIYFIPGEGPYCIEVTQQTVDYTEVEQDELNSLNGTLITAKSVTAEKIYVDDLVAFDATIGGFNITDTAIYSGVKASIDNPLSGLYLDKEGQMYLGDGDNYIKYYKDGDSYKLAISAESLIFSNSDGTNNSALKNILGITERVKIGTYTNSNGNVEPSIELSEGDSDFKQIITNTSAMYMDGGQVRTRIDTDGITTENLTVESELRQGGFIWSVRSNGNYGLIWKE